MSRKISNTVILMIMISAGAIAVPPYMWYSTYSIEDYVSNGACSWSDLDSSHDDADGFSNAIVGHNINNRLYYANRRDAACTAARWTGGSAETNDCDFLFYAGHGWGNGPYLGCNTGYPITSWIDIRFSESGFLKWVQAAACAWFVDAARDRAGSGLNEFDRWSACFKGVHTVQGHHAFTYDAPFGAEMSDEFWDRWVDNGQSIYTAWRYSQINWVYIAARKHGLEPATAASNSTYAAETWANAQDVKAPNGMGWFAFTTVGIPEY